MEAHSKTTFYLQLDYREDLFYAPADSDPINASIIVTIVCIMFMFLLLLFVFIVQIYDGFLSFNTTKHT